VSPVLAQGRPSGAEVRLGSVLAPSSEGPSGLSHHISRPSQLMDSLIKRKKNKHFLYAQLQNTFFFSSSHRSAHIALARRS